MPMIGFDAPVISVNQFVAVIRFVYLLRASMHRAIVVARRQADHASLNPHARHCTRVMTAVPCCEKGSAGADRVRERSRQSWSSVVTV